MAINPEQIKAEALSGKPFNQLSPEAQQFRSTGQLPVQATPKPTQAPAPTGTPSPAQTGTQTPNVPLDVFGTAMNEIRSKLTQNNDLTDQKRKLLTQLYERPLTQDEMTKLSPSQINAITSQNRNLVDMEIRLINDTVQGRQQTLDKSIDYITTVYEKQQAQTEKLRTDAQGTIKLFIQQYGDQAKTALLSIYGPEKVAELERMGGVDLSGIKKLPPTIAERKLGVGAIGSTSGAVDSMAQALLDGRLAPSQLPGFGQNSLKAQALRRAFEIDPSFNPAISEQKYSFGKATKTQLIQFSIKSVTAAQGIIKGLSNKVKRTDIQPINALELQFSSKTGNVDTSNFLGAIKILGDEYGTVFGQGAATDFKAQLGLAVLDPSLSNEQFNGLIDTTISLMKARSKALSEQAGQTAPELGGTTDYTSNLDKILQGMK